MKDNDKNKKEEVKEEEKVSIEEHMKREKKREQLEKLEKLKGKKGDVSVSEIATREKIERDFREDVLTVSFKTSTQTTRAIKIHRPNPKQMIRILKLATIGTTGNENDPKLMERMLDVYDDLPEMASELVIDKALDEQFWTESVSFPALIDFIFSVIRVVQTGGFSTDEMESFR